MGRYVNDEKKRNMDDEIELPIKLQSEMVNLHCLPDMHCSERSTMTIPDYQLIIMKR